MSHIQAPAFLLEGVQEVIHGKRKIDHPEAKIERVKTYLLVVRYEEAELLVTVSTGEQGDLEAWETRVGVCLEVMGEVRASLTDKGIAGLF